MGSPLYRQEQELERMGVHLFRQTMSNGILRAAQDWLKPVTESAQGDGEAAGAPEDGRLEIRNNRAKRSNKLFVIDRKNFLFANTPGVGRAARSSSAN